jgi:ferredoxin
MPRVAPIDSEGQPPDHSESRAGARDHAELSGLGDEDDRVVVEVAVRACPREADALEGPL